MMGKGGRLGLGTGAATGSSSDCELEPAAAAAIEGADPVPSPPLV